MGVLSQIMVFMTVTFLQPTLAVKLKDAGFGEIVIGTCFAIPTLIYAFSSPLIYTMTSKNKKGLVILEGYLIISIAMFLIGPSQLLGFNDITEITMVGLVIMGLGCGMIIIPVLPDMIEASEERHPGTDMDQLHNGISGLFIAAQGLGETLGPVLGSVFKVNFGFRLSQDILAISLLCFMVLYYLLCGRSKLFERPPPVKIEEEEQVGRHINATNSGKVLEPLLDNSAQGPVYHEN
jgi:MFS family permease